VKPHPSPHRTLQIAAAIGAATLFSGCVSAPPIQPAATSKSHFEGNEYPGDTLTLDRPTPGEESYRVFEQARTGEVPLQSVRVELGLLTCCSPTSFVNIFKFHFFNDL